MSNKPTCHPTYSTDTCQIDDHQIKGADCSLKIEWLTTKEAAEYIRLTPGSFLNLVSSGKIPYSKLGRRNRYLKSELMDVLLKERRGPNGN